MIRPTVKFLNKEIHGCQDCPYVSFRYEGNEGYVCEHDDGKGFITSFDYTNFLRKTGRCSNVPIPHWCPLEDLENQLVRVGTTVFIPHPVRNALPPQVLLGLRSETCETAKLQWALPGGRMEYGQTPEESAAREVWEETGIIVTKLRFVTYVNECFPNERKHYVSMVFFADEYEGNPDRKEDKCLEWKWFSCDKLPENVFFSIPMVLQTHRLEMYNRRVGD